MSVDGREAAAAAASATVAVIVALGIERASLRKSLARTGKSTFNVVQSGPGPERAARAAAAALSAGASALVSWGLAGALDPELAPGDVVLPRRVLAESGAAFAADSDWHAALARGLQAELRPRVVDLVTVSAALATPAAKAAARVHGAGATDMESAAIAQAAQRAGARFIALRVIVDAAADSLPGNAERWIDERGQRRVAPALVAAFQPGQWSDLWILAQRYRAARRSLDRLATLVGPHSFWAPASASAARG